MSHPLPPLSHTVRLKQANIVRTGGVIFRLCGLWSTRNLFQRAVNRVFCQHIPDGALKLAHQGRNLGRLLQNTKLQEFALREPCFAAAVLDHFHDFLRQPAIKLGGLQRLLFPKGDHIYLRLLVGWFWPFTSKPGPFLKAFHQSTPESAVDDEAPYAPPLHVDFFNQRNQVCVRLECNRRAFFSVFHGFFVGHSTSLTVGF